MCEQWMGHKKPGGDVRCGWRGGQRPDHKRASHPMLRSFNFMLKIKGRLRGVLKHEDLKGIKRR